MINQPELQANSDRGYLKVLRIVIVVVILCALFSIFMDQLLLFLLLAIPMALLVLFQLSSHAPLIELRFSFIFVCAVVFTQVYLIIHRTIEASKGGGWGELGYLLLIPVLIIGLPIISLFGSLMRKPDVININAPNLTKETHKNWFSSAPAILALIIVFIIAAYVVWRALEVVFSHF